MVEYRALVDHVTLWNVAVERQIRVAGPDAEAFVDYVITRDATRIQPMNGKYVILCNEKGGILNDPVLLRLSEDEFWFSLSDSDIMFWLQGVNVGMKADVEIDEIDVCPLQIQGPKSADLMADLVGEGVRDLPSYGLMEARVAGCDAVVSQTGFTGEKGYEFYLRDATLDAEKLWNAILEAGRAHDLMVIAPAHHRRIAAGILSWGQDMDAETLPFQCNLGYQVPRTQGGRLCREGTARRGPRPDRSRQAPVQADAGRAGARRQADRGLRARLLADLGRPRAASRWATSPRPGIRRSSKPTSRWATSPVRWRRWRPASRSGCRSDTARTRAGRWMAGS